MRGFLKLSRPFLVSIGAFFLILGFVGVFVPLLPTVPFLLISAYCFKRGSPRLHNWLLGLPKIGDSIREWDENRVIRPKYKVLAISLMSLSMGYVVFFRPIPWTVKLMIGLTWAAVSLYVLSQKSRPDTNKGNF